MPTDLYVDDEIIDFYDDNIDDATTEESDTTLPDTENQDQAPIIGDLTPIPVLTTLLSPSTPTTRLRRAPTRGSRPLPPIINAPITAPSPPVSFQIDLPEDTIDLADVLTSIIL